MTRPLRLYRLPAVVYEAAWRWQTELAEEVRNGGDEALLLLQHPPVYTFGRRVRPEHLLRDPAELRLRGAQVIETDRGGDVTFHGPGQLVGYPILDLRQRQLSAADYVHALEQALILTLERFGLPAERSPGRPGVWVDGAKVAAIGVHVSRGVTTHGFALNVDTDLSWFEAIIPCGLSDASVTSIERLLGRSPGIAAVEDAIVNSVATVFDVDPNPQNDDANGILSLSKDRGAPSLQEAVPSGR
jgi:lipoate-protein ligase B